MERDIKPTYDELESYIERLDRQRTDAQATIAALQKEIATRDSTDSILATRIRELEARLTQRTAELERVRALVKTYADAKIDFDDKRLQEDHHAWRERYTRLVGAETILIALTATSQEG